VFDLHSWNSKNFSAFNEIQNLHTALHFPARVQGGGKRESCSLLTYFLCAIGCFDGWGWESSQAQSADVTWRQLNVQAKKIHSKITKFKPIESSDRWDHITVPVQWIERMFTAKTITNFVLVCHNTGNHSSYSIRNKNNQFLLGTLFYTLVS